MALRLLEFALGLIIATATLLDVFETVVRPGASRGLLKVSQRLVWAALAPAKRLFGDEGQLPRGFAPFILLTAFLSWMALLILGIGLQVYGLRAFFTPPVRNLSDALYVAGEAVVTIGTGQTGATDPARWLVVAAGVCGISVMTMTITYVLQVQTGLHRREAGVLKLNAGRSRPPSGLEVLETYGRLGCRSELIPLFRDWREWSATVLQSHVAHPALVYFRSVTGQGDWTAGLGAVLDAAALTCLLLDEGEAPGVAALCLGDGSRLARSLGELLQLTAHDASPPGEEMLRQAGERLQAAGYRVKPAADATARMAALRAGYAGWLSALADRIGLEGPSPDLLADRSSA